MISINTLLKNTPIDEETKAKLLADLPTMNEQNKFELEMLCWETLAEFSELKFRKEKARIMQEVEEGKRKYNTNDFTEARAKIYHDLATQLEYDKDTEQLEEIRIQLEKHLKNN